MTHPNANTYIRECKVTVSTCGHEDLKFDVQVEEITDYEGGPTTEWRADLTITCTDCGERFQWVGVPGGYMPDQPTVSMDACVLRAPIRPVSHARPVDEDGRDCDHGANVANVTILFNQRPGEC